MNITIKTLDGIVKNHTACKVKDNATGKSIKVDVQSANAVLIVYGALSKSNQINYLSLGIGAMIDMAWKLLGKLK